MTEVREILMVSGIQKKHQKEYLYKFLDKSVFESIKHLIRDNDIEEIFEELKRRYGSIPKILDQYQKGHKQLPIPSFQSLIEVNNEKSKAEEVNNQIQDHLSLVNQVKYLLQEQAQSMYEQDNKDQINRSYLRDLKGREKTIKKYKNDILSDGYVRMIKFIVPGLQIKEPLVPKRNQKIKNFESVVSSLELSLIHI